MTEKRFKHFEWHLDDGQLIYWGIDDTEKNYGYNLVDEELVRISEKSLINLLNELSEENKQLKKELHLVHMKSMFSTVQSFKGDVSKRYKYSKETDTVYDTANNYGQYDKVLDKAEIVMLLNEYETVLNELKGDME